MNVFSLGSRNLHRNLRRSIITMMSIALGFIAIALFSGYTKMVYQGLTEQAIHGELIGHITIYKRGMKTEGRLHPERYLFTAEEITLIGENVKQLSPGAKIAPRLTFTGLASNGRVSTIFLAEGITPKDMEILRGPRSYASGALEEDEPSGLAVARGLMALLSLQTTDDLSLMVSTVHGQANAVDAKIIDTYSTGNANLEDKALFIPLALAQSLYDADGRADRISVLFPDIGMIEQMQQELARNLAQIGLDVEINTWQELSAFYRQVRGMFDMIFSFLLSIVLTIVIMSVTNAMTMSVVERTREIGTLRAIGLRRNGIIGLFLTEAALLVGIGCGVGLALTLLLRLGINALNISYIPPNGTDSVPLLIGIDIIRMLLTFAALVLLGLVAAVFPARFAARQPIIESLAHT